MKVENKKNIDSKTMDKKLVITFVLFLACIVQAQSASFSVTNYGAKADGESDITQALEKAWKEACASTVPSEVEIPKATFYLSQAKFVGPCKAPIAFKLQGTLQAHIDPSNTKVGEWITFQYIDQLTISGGGTFDGQGTKAWTENNCHKTKSCAKFPYNLSFNFVKNSTVGGVTTLNSKNFHVNVLGCENLTFKSFTVIAPENSPNTDGIHIGRSKEIHVTDSTIKTGDDCVSIGDGVQQVYVRNVICGPGHGISVGSLGRYQNEAPVSGIYIENCTLIDTTNGIRVKTWPDSFQNAVTDLHVKDIHVQNVMNPIIVDQLYCPWNQCSLKSPSKVKISQISFKNIWGTSSTPVVVKLHCSKSLPCESVELSDIDLQYTGKEAAAATSTCDNVKPIVKGTQNPKLCSSSSTSS